MCTHLSGNYVSDFTKFSEVDSISIELTSENFTKSRTLYLEQYQCTYYIV